MTLLRLHDICAGMPTIESYIEAGYLARQFHPELPYAILNYTNKTTYDRQWDSVTRQCRGLIYHTETEEIVARPFPKFFNYNEPGSPVVAEESKGDVYDKLDGCFPAHTTLNLWGGGTITIGEVVKKKLPVTVVGMNDNGELVPAVVTDWHHNGRKDHWLDIEVDAPVSRHSGAAGHPNRLRVTVNHHIFVNGEYKPAMEVRPGDTLVGQTWQPSEEVLHLVRASLLGDGCLTASATKPNQARYQEGHKADHQEYVFALRKALGDCAANRSDTTSGFGTRIVWAGSREYSVLGQLRNEWYHDGKKRLPDDLSWMDDFAVAKWFMDDGHRQQFKAQADRIVLSTHAFSREDAARLGDKLVEMYGVSYHLVNDRGVSIVVNSGRKQEIRRMWEAIAPHVHPVMRYKLPSEYRDVPYIEMPVGHERVVKRDVTVKSVEPVAPVQQNFPSGRTGFDITTTTGNYLARGVLVHNSLGILYPTPDGWAVATRGSFTSDQAQWATEWWQQRYANFQPYRDRTYLFEIIYPENRIVLDYGMTQDLFLLDVLEIRTGRRMSDPEWPGPRAELLMDAITLEDALLLGDRTNAEGFVWVEWATGTRVKVKQEDYIRKHRIVHGLNARSVWQVLADPDYTDEKWYSFLMELPEELQAWAENVAEGLSKNFGRLRNAAYDTYNDIVAQLGPEYTRRDFAELAKTQYQYPSMLFSLLDGKSIDEYCWKLVYPPGDIRPQGTVTNEEGE